GIFGDPADQGIGRDHAEVEGDVAGHEDAHARLRVSAERAEHVEKVVPAQLRVVDLEAVSVDLNTDGLALDVVDLDTSARFVVGDDVDLAADEADLELAHEFEVDGLRGVDEPFLGGHGLSFLWSLAVVVAASVAEVELYRVC